MWYADEHDMLGLHAGTKLVYARDATDDKLKKYGVFLFGLSATGKSTWSCHQLGLDFKRGERTEAIQDDIVFLRRDGSAHGSESGFFVKTDVEKDLQDIVDGRRAFTEEISDECLSPDIIKFTEKSYTIAPKATKTTVVMPNKQKQENETITASLDWQPKSRPGRASAGRYR